MGGEAGGSNKRGLQQAGGAQSRSAKGGEEKREARGGEQEVESKRRRAGSCRGRRKAKEQEAGETRGGRRRGELKALDVEGEIRNRSDIRSEEARERSREVEES